MYIFEPKIFIVALVHARDSFFKATDLETTEITAFLSSFELKRRPKRAASARVNSLHQHFATVLK